MGSDSFSNIDTWYKYEEFLAEVNLIVLMRPDCPIAEDSVAGKLLKERQVISCRGIRRSNLQDPSSFH